MADSLAPPDIVRSAYATLVVTDLAEARRFWVDLLGFVVTYEDSGALYLRGYDELTHHNLIVRSGPEAAAGALGYRVRSDRDLARAEAYYAALGCRRVRYGASGRLCGSRTPSVFWWTFLLPLCTRSGCSSDTTCGAGPRWRGSTT